MQRQSAFSRKRGSVLQRVSIAGGNPHLCTRTGERHGAGEAQPPGAARDQRPFSRKMKRGSLGKGHDDTFSRTGAGVA